MRKLIIVFLCCSFTLLTGYAGFRGYKVWKQKRMINLARAFAGTGDNRNALLCLQQALRANPQNLEACRMMAGILEAGRSPGALLWRSRVVELNPHSLEDRLALARTALVFRDYAGATNALQGVDAADKTVAAYHNVAGIVASSLKQLAEAEVHFREAVRLEPTNLAPQLSLAVIRLHATNAQAVAEARATLNLMAASPSPLRCLALRELLLDAMQSRQTNAALAYSKELVELTNSAFADRLLRLDVLKGSQSAEFQPALVSFQRDAGTNTAKIYELSLWQMSRTGPAETLAWLQTLPGDLQTNLPVALLAAECQMALGNWKALQLSLEPEHWAELELLRHAFLTRALRAQDLAAAAKGEWELALKAANDQKGALVMLLRLAAAWKWQSEAEELLWTVVNRYPSEKWAFQTLSRTLFAGGRTRSLMMLYSQEVKRSPSDADAKNNLAMTAMLLDAQELRPYDLAREAYQAAPTNAMYASTYAFALHLQQQHAEALKVMEQLRAEELESPSIAGYYGLLLKAAGNSAKAKSYLDAAAKATMLPEEQKLFERARTGV